MADAESAAAAPSSTPTLRAAPATSPPSPSPPHGPTAAPAPRAPLGRRRRGWRTAFAFARNCFALIGVLLLAYHLCFDTSEILSPSMSPTLAAGGEPGGRNDWVLTEKVSYRFRRPRRFEVVAFRNDDGIDVMKRVGGLPGETIASRDNWLVINGQPIARPRALEFLVYYPYGPKFHGGGACACGPNGYFVLGDHSQDSQDSRYDGPIDGSRLRGRAWLRVWPPSRIGFVN